MTRSPPSTQNQALSALLFLYREVLGVELPWLDDVVRVTGRAIKELRRLRRRYGTGRWRKRKDIATVRPQDTLRKAELHWYEAHGIGRREMKIKFPLLD